MSDFNSSLPVRTQNDGDIVAKIGDGTTPSQQLAIDASGRIITKMQDGAGNDITSQVNGPQRALDVGIDVAGVQIDPRSIRALTSSDVVTANQGSANTATNGWPVKPTDGTNSQSYTAAGEAKVTVTQPLPAGANLIGSVNQGTSPWITKDQSDGSPTGGTAGTFSSLSGGLFNTALPTLTNGQQASLQLDSSGKLLTNAVTSLTEDHNYGTVGASTLRTASQIGNATGSADFNNGATGAQTLRVAANLSIAGANVSITNPVPVTIEDSPGTHVNDFKDASAVASAATDNHDYTVTAGKTLHLNQIESTGSGKAKMIISIESGVATGTFNQVFTQFNSTANPNMYIKLENPISVAAGVRVRVAMKNNELIVQDLYSTISGYEV